MTDITTTPEPTLADLKGDADFVSRWSSGEPRALAQLEAATRAAVFQSVDDKPRPPQADGTGELLTRDQARALAQASVDAGQNIDVVKAALADTDPDWTPDTRPPAARAWAEDFEPGHPERVRIDRLEAHFEGAHPQEREAFADVVRTFVAGVGLDRSGGSEMAQQITETASRLYGQRPEALAQYRHDQLARLGEKAPGLVANAAKALQGVSSDVVSLLHKSGALDNADVIAQLAFMAQARGVRGGQQ